MLLWISGKLIIENSVLIFCGLFKYKRIPHLLILMSFLIFYNNKFYVGYFSISGKYEGSDKQIFHVSLIWLRHPKKWSCIMILHTWDCVRIKNNDEIFWASDSYQFHQLTPRFTHIGLIWVILSNSYWAPPYTVSQILL